MSPSHLLGFDDTDSLSPPNKRQKMNRFYLNHNFPNPHGFPQKPEPMPRTTSNDLQSKSAYQDYFKQKTFKERQEALVQEEAEQKRQFASNSGDKPFPCDVCGREFKRRSNMIAHMKTHDTDRKKIECTEANCGASFLHERNLRAHISGTGKEKQKGKRCAHGALPKHNQQERHQVMPKHNPQPRHQALPKHNQQPKPEALPKHSQQQQQQQQQFPSNLDHKPFTCDVCGRDFTRRSNLIAHMGTHETVRKRIECTVENCGASFLHERNLRAHISSAHSSQDFVCTYEGCAQTLASFRGLRNHMKLHNKKTQRSARTCPEENCGKTFLHERNLRVHITNAHSSQKFICTVEGCSQTLASARGLESHMKLHSLKPIPPKKEKDMPRLPVVPRLPVNARLPQAPAFPSVGVHAPYW